uniref:THAP domain-containing protein 1 n=1 Tax=Dicentrarchus labrax TaxID=13489 RepID=A0A8P4KEY8_DICLA
MVHTCVVAGCRNRRTPGTTLSFYRFPRDPERKQRWIAAVNREEETSLNTSKSKPDPQKCCYQTAHFALFLGGTMYQLRRVEKAWLLAHYNLSSNPTD